MKTSAPQIVYDSDRERWPVIRWMLLISGLLGMLGVMIGAYGAHGLERSLVAQGLESVDVSKRLEQCDIAVRYHMTHVLALMALGVAPKQACRKKRTIAAVFFLLGIALFSGGLYSMVFLGQMGHWAIVPSGGLCFMIGWLMVATLAFGREEQVC